MDGVRVQGGEGGRGRGGTVVKGSGEGPGVWIFCGLRST